jgi:hypothetical protein
MRKFLFLTGIFISTIVLGQDTFTAGLLPKINVSGKISGDVKITGNFESRHALYERFDNGEDVFEYSYRRLEASAIVSVKTRINQSLSGGYTLISGQDKTAHRFLQQYSIVSRFDAFRLGHRFAADQTIGPDKNWEYRGRYRITIEKALEGDDVDPGEFYLKINNEYLGIFGDEKPDLEIRALALLGYEINGANSIEFGPGYRVKNLSGNGLDQALWFSLNWYFSTN